LHGRSLEFFGPNHGHKQIGEQQQRDDADNDCFHLLLLQLLAEPNVKSADKKERDHNSGEDEIAHRSSFGFSQKREYSPFTPRMTMIPTKMNSLIKLFQP
jgi:hypothetical protein